MSCPSYWRERGTRYFQQELEQKWGGIFWGSRRINPEQISDNNLRAALGLEIRQDEAEVAQMPQVRELVGIL